MRRGVGGFVLAWVVGCAGEAPSADATDGGAASSGATSGATTGATTSGTSGDGESSGEGSSGADSTGAPIPEIDVQGHRGDRGNTPPGNTLPSFEAALAYGVDTLEGDLQITADGAVVFGHDDNLITAECEWAGDGMQPDARISTMAAEQVAAWDCHPELDGIQAPPPLAAVLALDDAVAFNLELKQQSEADADIYATALIAYDQGCGGCLASRLTLQAFAWSVLQYTRDTYGADLEFAASLLSFAAATDGLADALPYAQIWSPTKDVVTAERVAQAQALGFRVIPWTVNDPDEMQELVDAGVDGIITDYPDVLLDLLGR